MKTLLQGDAVGRKRWSPNNNFYRQRTGDLAIATTAKILPQMQGSDSVRDLRLTSSNGDD